MKILDPQSALLTNAEVQHFLTSNPVRPADPKIGGFATLNLQGYRSVRKDITHYTTHTTGPYSTNPSDWIPGAITRFKGLGLTKAESLQMINLGVGMPTRPSSSMSVRDEGENGVDGDGDAEITADERTLPHRNGDRDRDTENAGDRMDADVEADFPAVRRRDGDGRGDEIETTERDDGQLLAVVLEEVETRFTPDQREELLRVLKESIAAVDRQ